MEQPTDPNCRATSSDVMSLVVEMNMTAVPLSHINDKINYEKNKLMKVLWEEAEESMITVTWWRLVFTGDRCGLCPEGSRLYMGDPGKEGHAKQTHGDLQPHLEAVAAEVNALIQLKDSCDKKKRASNWMESAKKELGKVMHEARLINEREERRRHRELKEHRRIQKDDKAKDKNESSSRIPRYEEL